MKLKNGVEIVSLEKRLGRVRLRAPFTAANISVSPEVVAKLKAAGGSSLFFNFDNAQKKNDNFTYQRVEDVLPRDQDYIFVRFRALSKRIIPGHWLDFTQGNVLKDSVPLLLGATLYPNHDFFDINNWIGSVSGVAWDEDGEHSEGVPGIGTEYKVDALMNPRIARGLMMDPPAIHSTSLTILFQFDFSHPDLVEQGRFWYLLGEEVEGSIVRLIVTQIDEYWEASLVFQGADRLAKKQDEDEEEDFAEMSANHPDREDAASPPQTRRGAKTAEEMPPPNSNEEKTMKLNKEKKEELGIEFDGDDVPETEILKAAESHAATVKSFGSVKPTEVADLRKRAEAGDKYIDLQRVEVTRLAKLAELGAEEGDLPTVVAKQIADADFDTLVELEKYHGDKVAKKFPKLARSSEENPDAVDTAGGVNETKPAANTPVGLH